MRIKTLTEIEAQGLKSKFDLANGHASQELMPSQVNIINKLPDLWQRGLKQKSLDAERMFKFAFQQLANTPSLKNYEHYKICPTASNSIDIVAAWLAEHNLKTALLEPTFDNLYLILKRRGVKLTAWSEERLADITGFDKTIDTLFLVNPNNPTGNTLSIQELQNIIRWCSENKKILILDHSFRFFMPQLFDIYQLLLDEKITFICIEDTGKVWPTQEIKASLLCCSKNIYNEIVIIYDEIFLCHSNFALQLLSEFLIDAHQRGLYEAVWKEVERRRLQFRNIINGRILSIPRSSLNSKLSVEWVKVDRHFASDLDLIEYFQSCHLTILPGRQFYWSHKISPTHHPLVRFALLKPKLEFLNALNYLQIILGKIDYEENKLSSRSFNR